MIPPSRPIVGFPAAALLAAALGSASLAACASAARPAPLVTVREVDTPVPVACAPDVGPPPAYPDTDAALRAAPDLFARVRLLVLGRLARMGRERELTAALSGCGAAPRP